MASKAAEPGPTIIPARSSTTGTVPSRSASPVAAREAQVGQVEIGQDDIAETDDTANTGLFGCCGELGRRSHVAPVETKARPHRVH
jgi:hypothetical protein